MRVNPADGACRSCGGPLDVVDADDATITVACVECGDAYAVETDAIRDGRVDYWPHVMERLQEDADG